MKRNVFLILFVAVTLPFCVGWGPARDTYTIQNPSPVITFNSITDNPNFGDERNFVGAKSIEEKSADGWSDDITIDKSGKYYLRIYIENSSADNLNQIAQNTRIYFNIPDYESNRLQIDGYIESDNSVPTQIYDQVVFNSDKKFKIEYIPGSAKYENNNFTDGIKLSDDIINSNGVLVGYDQMNGEFLPGYKFDGYAIVQVNAIVEDQETIQTADLLNNGVISVVLIAVLLLIVNILKKPRRLTK